MKKFWQFVNKNGSIRKQSEHLGKCWVWKGTVNVDGYGYASKKKQGMQGPAHRCSYTLVKGKIPKGMMILHACDYRRCVNPSHLTAGTNQQNQQDRGKKGRRKLSRTERIFLGIEEFSPMSIVISRVKPPASDTAAELDRLAEETGETVQSIGSKAIRLGLPETERVLKQLNPKVK